MDQLRTDLARRARVQTLYVLYSSVLTDVDADIPVSSCGGRMPHDKLVPSAALELYRSKIDL